MNETFVIVVIVVTLFGAIFLLLHNQRETFLAAPLTTAAKGNTLKHGNNGTVSCEVFCRGKWNGGPRGSCVRAYANNTRKPIGCNVVGGATPGGVTCECGPSTFVKQNQRNDILDGPKCMASGLSLVSENKLYRAVMQTDGNFVVYERSKAIWATHHSVPLHSTVPIGDTYKPYRLCIDNVGNLSVTNIKNKQVWSSDSGGKDVGPFQLTMQNDGHLVLRGKHVPVWGSKWSTKCVSVQNWWKQNKNAKAVNPWADYVARLKRREYHVWPGPKCYDCEGAKRQYRLMYPDIGGIDAALHAADHKDRVWKGMTNCFPKPAPAVQKPEAKKPRPPPSLPPVNLRDPSVVDDWEQCGGLGGDSGTAPDKPIFDGPWPGKRCANGACVRDNPWYFECDPSGLSPEQASPPPPPPVLHPNHPNYGTSKPFEVPSALGNAVLQLLWSDEFASGMIDTSKWNYHLGDGTDYTGVKGWGNRELQCYTSMPENIRVENNMLVIDAKWGGYCVNPTSNTPGDSTITSGKIVSTHSFIYGDRPILISARIKVPLAKGSFPAFWLIPMRGNGSGTGAYGYWPLSGEIDIMEHINYENIIHTTVIHGYPNQPPVFQRESIELSDPAGWHIYTCLWTQTSIKTFVDGNLLFSRENLGEPFSNPNNPMHIALNLAVGGNWAGSDNVGVPFSMYVDYVLVHSVNF